MSASESNGQQSGVPLENNQPHQFEHPRPSNEALAQMILTRDALTAYVQECMEKGITPDLPEELKEDFTNPDRVGQLLSIKLSASESPGTLDDLRTDITEGETKKAAVRQRLDAIVDPIANGAQIVADNADDPSTLLSSQVDEEKRQKALPIIGSVIGAQKRRLADEQNRVIPWEGEVTQGGRTFEVSHTLRYDTAHTIPHFFTEHRLRFTDKSTPGSYVQIVYNFDGSGVNIGSIEMSWDADHPEVLQKQLVELGYYSKISGLVQKFMPYLDPRNVKANIDRLKGNQFQLMSTHALLKVDVQKLTVTVQKSMNGRDYSYYYGGGDGWEKDHGVTEIESEVEFIYDPKSERFICAHDSQEIFKASTLDENDVVAFVEEMKSLCPGDEIKKVVKK